MKRLAYYQQRCHDPDRQYTAFVVVKVVRLSSCRVGCSSAPHCDISACFIF